MRTIGPSPVTRVLAFAAPAALAALAVVLAGCGSSSPPATATTGAPGSPGAAAYAFATCMRNHGVSNFPEPQVTVSPGHASVKMVAPASLAHSSHFTVAQRACNHLLPGPQNETPAQRQARKQAFLAFAQCLRGHGVPNFPDPNNQGQLTTEMINQAGVDLHAPAVLTAAKACVGVTHGMITGADVERAINGPH